MLLSVVCLLVLSQAADYPGGERDPNNLDQYNDQCRFEGVDDVPGCTKPRVVYEEDGVTLKLLNTTNVSPIMPEVCISEHPEFDPNNPDNRVCCHEVQIEALVSQFDLLKSSFGKCEACYLNLANMYCAFTCDRNEARYISVQSVQYDDFCQADVPSISYFLTPEYGDAVYDSCKDTEMSGGFAVRALYPSKQEFFKMMSDVNPVMPINFVFDDTGYNNTNNQPLHSCAEMCSCQSCHLNCMVWVEDEPTFPDYPFLGGSLNIISIVSIHVTLLLAVAIMMFVSGFTYFKNWKMMKNMKLINIIAIASYAAFMGLSALLFVIGIIVIPFPANGIACSMPWGDGNIIGIVMFYLGIACALLTNIVFSMALFVLHFINTPRGQGKDFQPLLGEEEPQEEAEANDATPHKDFLTNVFEKYAVFLYRFWYFIVPFVIICCFVCFAGLYKIEFITDSLGLWVPDDCMTMNNKRYYDEMFGPFFRLNQFMLMNKLEDGGPVLTQPIIMQNMQIIDELRAINVSWTNPNDPTDTRWVTMDDVCYKPIFGKGCIVTSVTGYWQHDINQLMQTENVTEYIENCLGNPMGATCVDDIGSPVDPHNSLGNYTKNGGNPLQATILQTTMLFNQETPEKVSMAEKWEQEYIEILNREYSLVKIAFQAERSLNDELNRETSADVLTVMCSYVVMFIYISLSLGNSFYHFNWRTAFVKSRIFLSVSGIIIVLFSVFAAAGFFSWIDVAASLIITEVIPFLVLAIGVDNIFILTNTFDELSIVQEGETRKSLKERLVISLGRVGPSMMLASLSESLAFFLGYLTNMPAVQSFSLYAGLAIFVDFLLQVTLYAMLLVVDVARQEAHRLDIFSFLVVESDKAEERHYDRGSLLKKGFEYIGRGLMIYPVKFVIIAVFFAFFIFALNFVPAVELGLEQQTALPQDSYMQDYYYAITFLEIGPPLYIVIKDGTDYLDTATQDMICSSDRYNCSKDSIPNGYDAGEYVDGTTFAWIDDYFSWAEQVDCCRYDKKTGERCLYNQTDYQSCEPCFTSLGENLRPNRTDEFYRFLPFFLKAEIDEMVCGVNGQSYYPDVVWGNGREGTYIKASRLRLYHTVLVTQDDFISAMEQSFNMSDYFNAQTHVETFPYSYHYVYFQQYFDIVDLCVMDIIYALCAVFFVVMILMFDPVIAAIIVLCVSMSVIDLVGVMYLWNIQLNAVSSVNLVMSIGITIEFCVHIAHSFETSSEKTLNTKMFDAVSTMGNNVFVGITLTKLLGVIVLAFSSSAIFVIFYFRMYILILIFGASHGLFFLPAILSLVPTLNIQQLIDKFGKKKQN